MRTTIERVQAEFMEMPGLRLTASQVRRLCGVDRAMCDAVLDALVDANFLSKRPDGTYARRFDGSIPLKMCPAAPPARHLTKAS